MFIGASIVIIVSLQFRFGLVVVLLRVRVYDPAVYICEASDCSNVVTVRIEYLDGSVFQFLYDPEWPDFHFEWVCHRRSPVLFR